MGNLHYKIKREKFEPEPGFRLTVDTFTSQIVTADYTTRIRMAHTYSYIKLLIETKPVICALGNLHYKISREKFEPEPGFEPRTSGFLARRSTI